MTLDEIRSKYPEYSDLSDQELADKLYKANYSDMDRNEFNQKIGFNSGPQAPKPDQGFIDSVISTFKEIGEDLTYDNVVKYLVENQGLPIGIAGSIAGATVGAATPIPGGALVGGIVGGALGSGIGSATSDITAGNDVDIVKALTEAGQSLGIDVATLGLGKFIGKPIWNSIKNALNKGTPAEDIVAKIKAGNITPESRVTQEIGESQALAETVDASLAPSQLGPGVASRFEITKELLARTGILGKNVFEENQQKIIDLVKDRQSQLLSGTSPGVESSFVGQGIMDTLNEARRANIANYGAALEKIGQEASKFTINAKSLRNSILSYAKRKEFKDELGNSTLNSKTLNVIQEIADLIPKNVDTASGKFLIDLEKHVSKKINEVSSFGSASFDPTVARELTNLAQRIRAFTRLRMSRENPALRKEYVALQKSYGEFESLVFPDINKSFVRNAQKDSYAALGSMLTQQTKVENIRAIMKSLDKAYATPGLNTTSLPFKTADEAKSVIKRHYIENLLPKSETAELDIKSFSRFAENLKKNADFQAATKAVLGDDYGAFRQTVNLMANAAKKPEGGLATLFLRSREYAAGAGTVAAVGTGLMDVTTAGASLAGVLMGPVMLARIATSAKHVRKLLEIDRVGGKNPASAAAIASTIINDVVDEMYAANESEEDIQKVLGMK